jgi:hypothetical protein
MNAAIRATAEKAFLYIFIALNLKGTRANRAQYAQRPIGSIFYAIGCQNCRTGAAERRARISFI